MSGAIKLPVRKYYSFPDVLEHLKRSGTHCSMSDLLHFALIGAIEPIIYVSGEWKYKGESLNSGSLCKSEYDNNSDISFFVSIIPGKVITNFCTIDISEGSTTSKHAKAKPSIFILVEGFLSFFLFNPHTFYSDLDTYNEAEMSSAVMFPYSEYNNNSPDNDLNEDDVNTDPAFLFTDKSISTRDLYITHAEFELLKNGGRENHSRDIKIDINKQFSSPRPKTSNAQARVIKALIETIGGKHEANHPRSAIENPNSNLNVKLGRAGVKFPVTGLTVEKWLKGID
ncbi:hypothetical protein JF795_002443 [Salmonella enterica]|nr:hypothetical protein [Salmonella enterica]